MKVDLAPRTSPANAKSSAKHCGLNCDQPLRRSRSTSGTYCDFNGAKGCTRTEMAVALGAAHVLAVAEDGALLAWGAGAHGQLGT